MNENNEIEKDVSADVLAKLMIMRLKNISDPLIVVALKRELTKFNAHTYEWNY